VKPAEKCSLYRLHRPTAPRVDHHHVIPRAWQEFWRIDMLWDSRTVAVCPNCHRAIHEALVLMMRRGTTDDPLDAKLAAFGQRRLNRPQAVAYLGICRAREAGVKLTALRAAGLWGQQ
jgi:hypothetical protein